MMWVVWDDGFGLTAMEDPMEYLLALMLLGSLGVHARRYWHHRRWKQEEQKALAAERDSIHYQIFGHSDAVPVPDQLSATPFGVLERTLRKPETLPRQSFLEPAGDILQTLGVTVVVPERSTYGFSERVIRGLADRVHERIGIASEDLQGYTLRIDEDTCQIEDVRTKFLSRDRTVIVRVSADGVDVIETIMHELAHLLCGPTFFAHALPVVSEFIAISAEPRTLREKHRLNTRAHLMAFLRSGETDTHQLGLYGFHGLRYHGLHLLRDEVDPGRLKDTVRALHAASNHLPEAKIDEIAELLRTHSQIAYVPLFEQNKAPGLYVDAFFDHNDELMFLIKAIDEDGYECGVVGECIVRLLDANGTEVWMVERDLMPCMNLACNLALVRATRCEFTIEQHAFVFHLVEESQVDDC